MKQKKTASLNRESFCQFNLVETKITTKLITPSEANYSQVKQLQPAKNSWKNGLQNIQQKV